MPTRATMDRTERLLAEPGDVAPYALSLARAEVGGEGGIARGRGRPLILRFAPDRRGCAATSKNRSAIFVEPGRVRPHARTANDPKGPKDRPFGSLAEREGFEPSNTF